MLKFIVSLLLKVNGLIWDIAQVYNSFINVFYLTKLLFYLAK